MADMQNVFSQRVESLREIMRQKAWDAVIVSGSDPHSSEYPASRWKQVEWLSGFTGEAGDLVITADHAGLWTDTRYFIQALDQLQGTGIVLHKTRVPEQVLIPEWLTDHFGDENDIVVAVDGLCQRKSDIEALEKAFAKAGRTANPEDSFNYRIVSHADMLDALWENRPPIPQTPILSVPASSVGETREERIVWFRSAIAEKHCDSALVTSLDEIAWLLNVRGSDIEYNPMVISYVLVTEDRVRWFVRKDAFAEGSDPQTLETFSEVEGDGVEVLQYDELQLTLSDCVSGTEIRRLLVDPSTVNWSIYSIIADSGCIVETDSPIQLRKSVKTEIEIEGMKKAHFQDGLAMEKFLYWLEESLASGDWVDERSASLKLGALRAECPDYVGDSFATISAYGPGAALPHYITPDHDAPKLEPRGLYLCDSGGQFRCGTTDITRTVPLGECSRLEMEDYTLVLKGHIALSMSVFPEGTAGCQLDALARMPLWRFKRNFGHGTGHGVGFWLGVHEGPQEFRQNFNRQPFIPGMVTSVEPGIYREGKHGVRHENLVLCVRDGVNDFGSWLRFDPLTLCHIDTSAIIPELLSADELQWLNDYNRKVYETLSPYLPVEIAGWLAEKTESI